MPSDRSVTAYEGSSSDPSPIWTAYFLAGGGSSTNQGHTGFD